MPGAAARVRDWITARRRTLASVGMIASANLVATGLGVFGSLVQARYVSPDDLGFVRKYAVISGYAIFLSLGLFTIIQREYPVLIGQGKPDQARRVAAIGHSWSLLTSFLVCGALSLVCVAQALAGNWREAAAWLIQVVTVWSILYGGYLTCTFRSGQEFERLAKSSYLGAIATVVVLPLFAVWPFATLVLRSIAGTLVTSAYQHAVRPLRVEWRLPWREFKDLVVRGIRLFVGTYLRYGFWPTVEIWLLVRFGGDAGVGLFTFSAMIATSVSQVSTAINQIYVPRLAQHYGKTGSVRECLQLARKPTLVSVAVAMTLALVAALVLPGVLRVAFPRYAASVPLMNVLLVDTVIVALSLPLYMVAVLEGHRTQTIAAVLGLAVLWGVSTALHAVGQGAMAVAWGTIAGRLVFVLVCLASLRMRLAEG